MAVDACPWPLPPQGIDIGLLLVVISMVAFGLLMVYSSSFIYAQERAGDGFAFIKKQLLFALLGFTALAVTVRVDYRKWAKWAYPLLGAAVLMLALIMIPGLGHSAGGANRWLRLGPLSFQPGEFAKFAVILFVAYQLDRKRDRIHKFVAGVLSHFIVPLPALILLLLQPDFGTTVMISIVIFALMFLAGVPKRYLISAVVLAGMVAAWLALGTPYRRQRLMTFMDPWQDPSGKGFQIIQSLVGLSNGGITGVGLGNGKGKLFFLPEAHNDFIFAVVGEELGFVGIATLVVAYLFLVHRGLRIAMNCQTKFQDNFGMLLAVVLGLVPTKGLTLPFISYGGSALLIDLAAAGILLSIARGPQSVRKT